MEFSCDLCGSRRHTFYLQAGLFQLQVCNDCNLIFRFPPQQDPERLSLIRESVYYDHSFHTPSEINKNQMLASSYEWQKAHYLIQYLSRFSTVSGKRIVDIGCGVGFFLSLARKQGAEVLGIDISDRALTIGRKLLRIPSRVMDFPKDFRDTSLSANIITLNDILEHLDSPTLALSLANKWLSYDGLLLIRTPNVEYPSTKKLLKSWRLLQPQDHLYFFSTEVLLKLIMKTGYRIIDVETKEWLIALAVKQN